jgi:extracellular factor (EF) 3-hydroxypalmitic acid methyl ester biosynthesis protein
MTQSYEDLSGALGHSVNFRARRVTPRSLNRAVSCELTIDREEMSLADFSTTGLSYRQPIDWTAPSIGSLLSYRITMGDETAAHGRARVVRIKLDDSGHTIGIEFLDSIVTPDELSRIGRSVAFGKNVSRGLDCYSNVPDDYRRASSEVHVFLSHWQRILDQREAEITADLPNPAETLSATEELALVRMREEWTGLRLRAGQAVEGLLKGSPAYQAARELTAASLQPFLSHSPFLERCLTKPRGYPGDFVAMGWMYDGVRRGETVFGRCLDQLGLEERLAATVASRKDALMLHLQRCIERRSTTDRPLRILNLGAGPARELEQLLVESHDLPQMELILVDQDDAALSTTHDRLVRAALKHDGKVRIRCRHVSFQDLFAAPEIFEKMKNSDLVYSAGLFDYLRKSVADALIQQCFALLAPGGRLLVGNAAAAPVVRWVPEFVLDWTMVYRSPDEMSELAAPYADQADIETGADESGSWHLVALTRHAD